MRRFISTILFTSLILIAPAFGAEAPVKPEPGLPSTGMTLNDCLLILQGLNAIDGHIVIIGNPPNQQAVQQSYEYGNAAIRLAMAKDIRILTAIQQDAQGTQKKIEAEVFKGKTTLEPLAKDATEAEKADYATRKAEFDKNAAEYDRQLRQLTASPCSADLVHIKSADLKLEKNELPVSALVNLDKILDK